MFRNYSRLRTNDDWIELMSTYPRGSVVQFIAGGICFIDPKTGKAVHPTDAATPEGDLT